MSHVPLRNGSSKRSTGSEKKLSFSSPVPKDPETEEEKEKSKEAELNRT